jgi:hypothetical protein
MITLTLPPLGHPIYHTDGPCGCGEDHSESYKKGARALARAKDEEVFNRLSKDFTTTFLSQNEVNKMINQVKDEMLNIDHLPRD